MLPKKHRLRLETDIAYLYKKGRTAGNKQLVLKFLKTANEQPLRVAVIISKKTEKSAVKRHRVKRQLREVIRSLIPILPNEVDMAFVMKTPFVTMSFDEKKLSVIHVLKQAGLIEKNMIE